jgi:tetratricopeptide (TPR) repeat protein
MENENYITSDLNELLEKYLTQEDINEYIDAIASYFLPQQPLRLTKVESQLNKFFNENIQTKKIRLLSDTLITFVSKKLSQLEYIKFLLEFSKRVLAQGENDLSFEITNIVYKAAEKEYEIYKAHALILLAEFYMGQALWKDALNSIRTARVIYESDGNKNGVGKCEFLIGSIYVEQGDLKAGKVRLTNCLSLIDRETELLMVAQVEVHFGIIYCIEGNFQAALKSYEKSIRIFEQLSDIRRAVEVLLNKAMIYRKLGKNDFAVNIFNKCSDIARKNGLSHVLKLSFLNKAEIFLEKGELEVATQYSHKAVELCYLLNDRLSTAEVHKILGKIAMKRKNQSLAENHLLTSLRLNHELSQELNAAETDYELGLLYKNVGKKSEALHHMMNALQYYTKNNSKTIYMEIQSQVVSLNN